MSGGGTQTTTEHSQTSYPQWSQDAMQNTYGTGAGMMENFLRNPQYAVAGMNTDQMKAFDLARDTARNAFTSLPISVPGSPNLTAANAIAAQVTPAAIQGMMNPFTENVTKVAMDSLRRAHLDNDAQIAAKYAAASGVGGSGEAIARGQAARAYYEQAGNTAAQLQAAGFDKATAAALANAQFQQQANLANAGAENSMRTTGADYGMKAAQLTDQFRTTQQAREEAARMAIMQGGNAQQQFAQSALNVPWTMLQLLMNLSPKQLNYQTDGTKETEGAGASPLQSVLGLGSTLLGAAVPGGGSIAGSLFKSLTGK